MNKQGFGQVLSELDFAALKRGKKSGFNAAYQLFSDRVYSLSLHLLSEPHNAADILQQVFEKLLLKSSTLKGRDTVGVWLKQTTINACMAYFRRHKKEFAAETLETSEPQTAEFIAETLLIAPDFSDESQVLDYLSQLPYLQRSVVYFYAVHELKHREIAPSLGIDEANSRQIYRRALAQLRSWLEKASLTHE
ncbi:MAG: RNA polymerase sigma factor (sigma-70 family) [Phenylobacterium sp.]|jgi:RNA polymerase sigma factor (sigma-70 family)